MKTTTKMAARSGLRHWMISHAPYGETVQVDDLELNALVRELDKGMPMAEWRNLGGLFDSRADDEFMVPAARVEQIADALRLASCSPYLTPSAVELAERLAAAAAVAATVREPWRWVSRRSYRHS
jgi:hypothetical protein